MSNDRTLLCPHCGFPIKDHTRKSDVDGVTITCHVKVSIRTEDWKRYYGEAI